MVEKVGGAIPENPRTRATLRQNGRADPENRISAGILNWLLEGRTKLAKAKLQLTQTPEQKARSVNLLLASDSPSAFVRRAW